MFNGAAFLELTATLKNEGHTLVKCPSWLTQAKVFKHRNAYNESLKEVVAKEKPDVYICSKGFKNGPCVYPETTRFIQKHAGITVYLSQDDPFFMPNFVKYKIYTGYKIALTCSTASFRNYKTNGIKPYLFWPAFDTKLRKIVKVNEGSKTDFIFIGSPYVITKIPRRRFIQALSSEKMSINLYGDKSWLTSKKIGLLQGDDKFAKYYKGVLLWQDVHNYYARSRFTLSNHIVRARDYLNDRVPMVLGSGALLFLDMVPGLQEVFKHNKHVVYYKNLDDFVKKALFYKKHIHARNKISSAGRNFVLKHHTYKNRAYQLLKILKENGMK